MTTTPAPGQNPGAPPVTVDAARYAAHIADQRNTALNQLAQVLALLEETAAERDRLAAENQRLRQAAAGEAPPP